MVVSLIFWVKALNISDTMVARIIDIAKGAFQPATRTILWLLKLMIPITLTVRLLQYFGIIEWLATFLNPIFQYMGLPGASAIAFLTAAASTTYAGLAIMLSMELTMREMTILAVMALLCHALPMECAVVKKVGSNPYKMAVIRIIAAFLAAFYLNWVLPATMDSVASQTTDVIPQGESMFIFILMTWLGELIHLSLMISILIYGLMVLQRILDDFGIMYLLTKPLRPLMLFFGLPENASYLWLVGNVLGISYGSAMMLDLEEAGQITREEANEVNYHLIMNHSMLEDTLVFATAGVSAAWILSTRILFAFILVWGRKVIKLTIKN